MNYAFGYIRVSGKRPIKGDGFTRQERSISEYAQKHGFKIVKIYKERGVSGALRNRPALAELIVDLEQNGHGITTVIVEKLDRIARDLIIQESVIADFHEKDVGLISALEGADFLDNDPTRKLVRQVLGAIAEYQKALLVAKLRVARQRKKIKSGKCEGRKPYKEAAPETVALIRKLRRKPRGGKRKTYQEIADHLNSEGVSTLNGQPWSLQTVRHAWSS